MIAHNTYNNSCVKQNPSKTFRGSNIMRVMSRRYCSRSIVGVTPVNSLTSLIM